MTSTLLALAGFIAWTILPLLLMELLRVRLVVSKPMAANVFRPDNANLSPFMQHVARAHANCLDSLPTIGGLMILATASGNSSITGQLAFVPVCSRIDRSLVHVWSHMALAVNVRFLAFLARLAIAMYWAVEQLAAWSLSAMRATVPLQRTRNGRPDLAAADHRWQRPSASSPLLPARTSAEARPSGKAPDPASGCAYHPVVRPGTSLSCQPHLERWTSH